MFHSWLWFAKEIAEEISPKADCSRWLDAQAWYLPFDLPMLPSKDILMKLWDQDKPRSVESVPILSDFNVVSLASYSTFSFWWQAHGRGAAEVPCTNTERKESIETPTKLVAWIFCGQSIGRAAKLLPDGRWEERLWLGFSSEPLLILDHKPWPSCNPQLLRSFACRSSRWLLRVQRFLIFGWLGWSQHAFYYKYIPEA